MQQAWPLRVAEQLGRGPEQKTKAKQHMQVVEPGQEVVEEPEVPRGEGQASLELVNVFRSLDADEENPEDAGSNDPQPCSMGIPPCSSSIPVGEADRWS